MRKAKVKTPASNADGHYTGCPGQDRVRPFASEILLSKMERLQAWMEERAMETGLPIFGRAQIREKAVALGFEIGPPTEKMIDDFIVPGMNRLRAKKIDEERGVTLLSRLTDIAKQVDSAIEALKKAKEKL